MGTLMIIALIMGVTTAIVFFSDLFPKCDCCSHVKPRIFFRLHRHVRVGFGRKANKSVCRSCCRKYSIYNLSDLKRVNTIRERIKLDFEVNNPASQTIHKNICINSSNTRNHNKSCIKNYTKR